MPEKRKAACSNRPLTMRPSYKAHDNYTTPLREAARATDEYLIKPTAKAVTPRNFVTAALFVGGMFAYLLVLNRLAVFLA